MKFVTWSLLHEDHLIAKVIVYYAYLKENNTPCGGMDFMGWK